MLETVDPVQEPVGEAATLWHGDSRELLARIPDQSVDLICTDPPYNLGTYSTGNIDMAWRKSFNNDVAGWDQLPFDPGAWLDELRRVLKPTGTLFAFTSYNLLGRWHEAFDPVFDTFQFVVWHKTNPPPKLRRAGFLNSCEQLRELCLIGCLSAVLLYSCRNVLISEVEHREGYVFCFPGNPRRHASAAKSQAPSARI